MEAQAALERIRSYVLAHRQHLAAPGVALAVTDRERCLGVVLDGLANVDAGEPVAPHHRFQIGSISKGFTALAILQQVEEGRVELDAPVTRYLPWFEVQTRFEPITIHHLLSHTSGLVAGTDFTGEARSEVWSLRDTVTGFPPGERFLYSNVGYKALGLVLESATGEPWWSTVHRRVMTPIGMGDAGVVITNAVRDVLAIGYRSPFEDRPWLPMHGWAPSPWFESGTADGTLCATAEELTAYARLLLRGGEPVVSAASFRRMTTPVAADPEDADHRYGYGVKWIETEGRPRLLGHSGGMIGFTAYVLVDVDAGIGVTVLMNSAFGRRLDLARFALDSAATAAGGEPMPEVPEPRDPRAVDDAERYAGAYVDVEDGTTRVIGVVGDRLRLENTSADLWPVGDDTFAVVFDDGAATALEPIRFVREPNDDVRMRWGSSEYEGMPRPDSQRPPAPEDAFTGRYASWNPWAPGFRVLRRPSGLWLSFTGESLDVEPERRLQPLDDGWFRVGEAWSPDRVRFDMVIDGLAQRATYDGAPFYRTFVP